MQFNFSKRSLEYCQRLQAFMDMHIYPGEGEYARQLEHGAA